MMPNLESNLSNINEADKSPGFTKTPADLASQLKIMEELGKTCRETPISIVESDSHSYIGLGRSPKRDAT